MQSTRIRTWLPVPLIAALAVAGTLAAATAGGVAAGSEADLLQQLAKSGDAGAALELGLAYREGRDGLAHDPAASLHWLHAAAEGGNAYAADLVADTYAGQGKLGRTLAVDWWQQSAQAGNADAQRRLGEYLLGQGQEDQAVDWLRAAADRGDDAAHADLTRLYQQDTLTEADLHRGDNAIAAFGKRLNSPTLNSLFAAWNLMDTVSPAEQTPDALIGRAEQGDPVAEYQLGVRYSDGAWTVTRDQQQSVVWLQRAAEHGNRLAARALAEMQHSTRSIHPQGVVPDASQT